MGYILKRPNLALAAAALHPAFGHLSFIPVAVRDAVWKELSIWASEFSGFTLAAPQPVSGPQLPPPVPLSPEAQMLGEGQQLPGPSWAALEYTHPLLHCNVKFLLHFLHNIKVINDQLQITTLFCTGRIYSSTDHTLLASVLSLGSFFVFLLHQHPLSALFLRLLQLPLNTGHFFWITSSRCLLLFECISIQQLQRSG